MPLLDHFHPPLAPRRHWESFHVNWAGAIADALNESLLPEGYFAEEHAQLGTRVEIDVATFTDSGSSGPRLAGRRRCPSAWAPPAPALVVPAAFPDGFEVLVFESEGGTRLVAAIELVSPGNKDRDRAPTGIRDQVRQLFVPGNQPHRDRYRDQPAANLHDEMMQVLGHPEPSRPRRDGLYAVAYRPIVRDQSGTDRDMAVAAGNRPALARAPAGAERRTCLPIDLEATYMIACQRRRLA